MNRRFFFGAAALLAAANPLSAQSFNIDYGLDSGTPTGSFGAASGQTGFWQSMTGFEDEPTVLIDTSGAPSAVTQLRSLPFGQAFFDHAATAGDVASLFDDYFDLHSVPTQFEFDGLVPGEYLIYTYAWAPDDSAFKTSVWFGEDGDNAQLIGGAWPGGFAPGITHALHTTVVSDDRQMVMHLFGFTKGTLNGLQIVPQAFHLWIAPEPAVPGTIDAGEELSVTIRIMPGDETLIGAPALNSRADGNSGFSATVMSPLGGGLWTATLPGFACGDAPELYVAAAGSLSGGHAWPAGGEAAPHALAVRALDGDLNGDGSADGRDIAPFAAALLAQSTDVADLCHADFDGLGSIDASDIASFVGLLTTD